jgi:hypothetical protein
MLANTIKEREQSSEQTEFIATKPSIFEPIHEHTQ